MQKTLAKLIHEKITHRIIFAFVVLLVAFFLASSISVYQGFQQVKGSAKAHCFHLQPYVVSQYLVDNLPAIQQKLASLSESTPYTFKWQAKAGRGRAGMHLSLPMGWYYSCPIVYQKALGSVVISGRYVFGHALWSKVLIHLGILIGALLVTFIILRPLIHKIPEQLFIQPINSLISLLRSSGVNNAPANGMSDFASKEVAAIFAKIQELMQETNRLARDKALNELAIQVAHDIRSPLTALNVLVSQLESLPVDSKKMVKNAVRRVNDIANNLLNQYKLDQPNLSSQPVEVEPKLIVNLVEQIISEKRLEYSHSATQLAVVIDPSAMGSFAAVNSQLFSRALSNLINNAYEAFEESKAGAILVRLENIEERLVLLVKDNGKGIPEDKLDAVLAGHISIKKGGAGIGLVNARKWFESWGSKFHLSSVEGEGTTITITLPQVSAPTWFAKQLLVLPEQSVVVIDNDLSIQELVKSRFQQLSGWAGEVKCFSGPAEFASWAKTHQECINHSYFIVDYEFSAQEISGFEFIQRYQLANRATLVTSHYNDPGLHERVQQQKVRIVPKFYVPHIPIVLLTTKPKLVLIDDSDMIREAWHAWAAVQAIDIVSFDNPHEFLNKQAFFAKDIPVYIDSNLGPDCKGEVEAEEIYNAGFKTIYLITGYERLKVEDYPWIMAIVGKEPPTVL